MGKYRISGVWKDGGSITYYAMHTIAADGIASKGTKTSKADAIKILDTYGNSAETRVWNYKEAKWYVGEKVEVVNGKNGKYLRSDPDNSITDNLGHLIDYSSLN